MASPSLVGVLALAGRDVLLRLAGGAGGGGGAAFDVPVASAPLSGGGRAARQAAVGALAASTGVDVGAHLVDEFIDVEDANGVCRLYLTDGRVPRTPPAAGARWFHCGSLLQGEVGGRRVAAAANRLADYVDGLPTPTPTPDRDDALEAAVAAVTLPDDDDERLSRSPSVPPPPPLPPPSLTAVLSGAGPAAGAGAPTSATAAVARILAMPPPGAPPPPPPLAPPAASLPPLGSIPPPPHSPTSQPPQHNQHTHTADPVLTDAAMGALAAALTFDRDMWQGPLPSAVLERWAATHNIAPPSYDVAVADSGAGTHVATIVLPHAGVQITPERPAATAADAMEAAALLGVAWLEGGLPPRVPGVRVSRAGAPTPAARARSGAALASALAAVAAGGLPTADAARAVLERRAAALKRQRDALAADFASRSAALDRAASTLASQAAALDEGGAGADAVLRDCAAAAASLAAGRGDRVGDVTLPLPPLPLYGYAAGGYEGAAPKNPVQELKEVCDRCRWAMPRYEFRGGGSGGFACLVCLADGGIPPLLSPPSASQKAAKASAAARALAALRATGALP